MAFHPPADLASEAVVVYLHRPFRVSADPLTSAEESVAASVPMVEKKLIKCFEFFFSFLIWHLPAEGAAAGLPPLPRRCWY